MRFTSDIIKDSIANLMSLELIYQMQLTDKFQLEIQKVQASGAHDIPKKIEILERRRQIRLQASQERIVYLQNLRTRLKASQTEESLISLLKEIEGIQIKSKFVVDRITNYLKASKSQPIHSKKGEPRPEPIIYSTGLDRFKTTVGLFVSIHDFLNASLVSLRTSNNLGHRMILGTKDNLDQINSPAITEFIRKGTATSDEVFGSDPPALSDIHRGILVNGKALNCTLTDADVERGLYKTPADKLKALFLEFLNSDDSLRNNPQEREALCNAMLKNAQALQAIFTNEFAPENYSNYPLVDRSNTDCILANTITSYNWTIQNGHLTMDLELDVKTVMTTTPQIIDQHTGIVRELDDELDDFGTCPTIIRYQGRITFDTASEVSSDELAQPVRTLAIPSVDQFEVSVFHDEFQYKPTLTDFHEFHVSPNQAPTPSKNT